IRGWSLAGIRDPRPSRSPRDGFPSTMLAPDRSGGMEQSPRNHWELLERLINTVPGMITIYDPGIHVVRVNREFERLVGQSTEDAAGISLMAARYSDPDDRREVAEFMESCREGWMDIRMRTRDGLKVLRKVEHRNAGFIADRARRRTAMV